MLHLPIPRGRLRSRRANSPQQPQSSRLPQPPEPPEPCGRSLAHDEIYADLPDEDLSEDLADTLDLYRSGSKPRCEEAEYRDLIQDAVDRMAREG